MNDLFLRQQLNQLTGTTVFSQKVGPSVVVPMSTWTPLTITGLSDPLGKHLTISAYQLIVDQVDFLMRMVVDGTKIFPFPDSVGVISGVVQLLAQYVKITPAHTFELQVFSPTGGNASVDFLSVVEIETYDNV